MSLVINYSPWQQLLERLFYMCPCHRYTFTNTHTHTHTHTHTDTLSLTHTQTHTDTHTHTQTHTDTHTHTHTHTHRWSHVSVCCLMRSHDRRSEEHTSELQSHLNIVPRLLLEKK